MPAIHPFRPLTFAATSDLSKLIAPPYDVLDAAGKARLLARDPRNIVGVDLPHTPAKELGPASAYARAADELRAMVAGGVLRQYERDAIVAYRQRFTGTDGRTAEHRTIERCGVCCAVDALPFGPRAGGGILPHEETFSGPKEDRMALMKATRTQLSPIFGLHPDMNDAGGRAGEGGAATRLVRSVMASRAPDAVADMGDGVTHETWTIDDAPTIRAYQDALRGEDIFIADGHHRYTTQLNYIKHLEQESGKPLPQDHPARRCMMVLVSMNDPGLVIWPTHRVLGGMKDYSFDRFLDSAREHVQATAVDGGLRGLERELAGAGTSAGLRVGLYDFATGRAAIAAPPVSRADPLSERFASKPRAWRQLDVAWVQYVLVEEVCQAKLNGGNAVKWAFPHTIEEVEAIGRGDETGAGGGRGFAQLAVIVRPTPLEAVREVSRAGELMPQKSTFFYPKLATGLWLNGLE